MEGEGIFPWFMLTFVKTGWAKSVCTCGEKTCELPGFMPGIVPSGLLEITKSESLVSTLRIEVVMFSLLFTRCSSRSANPLDCFTKDAFIACTRMSMQSWG